MRIITPTTYRTDPSDRDLADTIVRHFDLDLLDVVQIEVSEAGVVVEELVRIRTDGRDSVAVVNGDVVTRRRQLAGR